MKMSRFVAWALSAGLAGCAGGLLPAPPALPSLYTLDDARPAAPALRVPATSAPTLVVAAPRPAAGYDSAHMLYLRQPQALERFAWHAWVDTPARLLAPLLVHALQDTGAFRAVLLAPSAGTGAWRLETELIRLHQDFGTRPSQVRLTLRAVLLDSTTREVIGWREFDRNVPAAADDPVAGAAAAQQATQQVLAELAAFCAAQAVR